jgi:hypothetical protein
MPVRVQNPGDYSVGINPTQNTLEQGGYTGNSAQAKGIEDPNSPGAQAANRVANYYNSIGQGGTPAALNAETQTDNAIAYPDSTLDKVMQGISLAGSMVGVGLLGGAVIAPELATAAGATGASIGGGGVAGSVGTGLGSVVGSAGAGAFTGAIGSGLQGQNIGKGALLGGLGGGLGAMASPAASGLSDITGLPSSVSAGLVKAGIGGATSAAAGSNPLLGAISSGVGSLASSGASNLGLGAASGFVGGQIGNQIGLGIVGPGGQNNMIGGGSINPQTYGGSMGQAMAPGGGSFNPLGSIGGLFGAGMGIAANNQQSNLQQNAYTTAGNAANYNPFNFSGLGGMGSSFANGTGTLSAGGFNPGAFQGLTNTALGSAGQYAGGGLPQGVAAAGNNYMSALGGAQGNAQTGMAGGMGMYGAGANLVGGANGTYNSAYNTSLSAAQQALQQPFQQQTNALRNQQFETGMSGTSGGALQTQALATGQGQAELQAQQNAVSQANTAQSNALGYGTNLMNSGLGQFGNFNQQGAGFAGQGMNAQMGLGSYSPQLSALYANLANTGVSGLGGVQGMDTSLAQLGLQGMQIGGNNMNNAARTQDAIAQSPNYTNQNAGYGTALNSLFGNAAGGGGLFGGLGSAFSGLFGGGGPSSYNPPDMSGNGGALQTGAINATAPSFDFSNIGNDASNLDLNFGNY